MPNIFNLPKPKSFHKILVGLVFVLVALLVFTTAATAQTAPPPEPGIANEDCLACHDTPGMRMDLPSGEVLFITVDSVTYATSTHGRGGYACVQCHTEVTGYPHEPLTATTRRDLTIELNASCERCHADNFEDTADNVHADARAAGNPEAALCTDCHGAHDVGSPTVPRSRIPQTCERCHSGIYSQYEHSVHGEALIGEGNPDVPTCIDCHGSHALEGPSGGPFRLFSPQVCLECHADEEMMSRYGLSADVGETYLADFHGTTVKLFEELAPDQETNKPVCIDCHGTHDIRATDDPESRVIKGNLLVTCQRCHPDATTNFPASWLSHYEPTPDRFPLVYFVNIFYIILIPGVLGVMTLYIISDIYRRVRDRRAERQND